MGKSIRSKVKRHFRAKKREEGVFAATEAARLQRLSAKLTAVRDADKDGDLELGNGEGDDDSAEHAQGEEHLEASSGADAMQLDGSALSTSTKKISTHGPRGSRREEWRASKGLDPRPKPKGMNRIGGVAARTRAGRPKRRR